MPNITLIFFSWTDVMCRFPGLRSFHFHSQIFQISLIYAFIGCPLVGGQFHPQIYFFLSGRHWNFWILNHMFLRKWLFFFHRLIHCVEVGFCADCKTDSHFSLVSSWTVAMSQFDLKFDFFFRLISERICNGNRRCWNSLRFFLEFNKQQLIILWRTHGPGFY